MWIVRLIILHARVFLSNNKLTDFMTLGMNNLPLYSPQITSWSQQGMRFLWQCKVPRAEVFVTIQRENICTSKEEMNKAVKMLIIKNTLQWLH
jgi:hypothetical protein